MIEKQKAAAVLLGILSVTVTPTLYGQWAVIDVGAIAEIVNEVAVARNIYTSSQQIYTNATKQLQDFRTNVTALGTKTGWQTVMGRLSANSVVDRFGENQYMTGAMNSGQQSQTAWRTASVSPGQSLGYLSTEVLGQSQSLANLATVEMQDSAGATSIKALGDYRAMDQGNTASFQRLVNDVSSNSPAYNTEAAQLNLANAIAIQKLAQDRQANALHAALLEQQLAANKYQRDAAAGHLQTFGNVNRLRGLSNGWQSDPNSNAFAAGWLVP